jgi:hypothetical protein
MAPAGRSSHSGTEGLNPASSSSESDELPPEQERVAGSQRRSLRRLGQCRKGYAGAAHECGVEQTPLLSIYAMYLGRETRADPPPR